MGFILGGAQRMPYTEQMLALQAVPNMCSSAFTRPVPRGPIASARVER